VVLLLILIAVVVHTLAILGVPSAMMWLVKYPFDSNGAFHYQWFTAGFPCALYLACMVIALLTSVAAIVRRVFFKGAPLDLPDMTSKDLGLKFGPILLIHPLILLLGAFAIFSSFVGEVGRATYYLGGNPARFVTSDDGVAGRASRMPRIHAYGITDKGIADLAKYGPHLVWLQIDQSPAVTAQGLRPLADLKLVHSLRFATSGDQQSAWGNDEAMPLTQSPALETVILEGFPNLTDAFLDALPARCPKLRRAEVKGPNLTTPEAWARFEAAVAGRGK